MAITPKYPVSAQRIAEALDDRGITQQQLTIKTGIAQSSISQYATGKHRPTQEKAILIGKALGVSPEWLMGYDADKYSIKTPIPLDRKYKTTSTPEEFERIIVKYRALDARGKSIVDTVLDAEYQRTFPALKAAHEKPGATDEQKRHDDQIMESEDF